eukprot:scaffold338_cov361-Pavlova_lutheri.AAC.25
MQTTTTEIRNIMPYQGYSYQVQKLQDRLSYFSNTSFIADPLHKRMDEIDQLHCKHVPCVDSGGMKYPSTKALQS